LTAISLTVDTDLPYLRTSFFTIINLFGPTIFVVTANHYGRRDLLLTVAADEAIVARIAEKGPQANEDYIRVKIQLELQTVLCTEYRCALIPAMAPLGPHTLYNRNKYFAAVNLIGCNIFDLTGDFHHQRDGTAEAEAARIDDLVERIRHAA
jgi:hypothetical protein